jgi:predicted nuclease with TOPRIM domain
MNTETLNALKEVREGLNTLQQALTQPGLAHDEKELLSTVLLNLKEQEDILINNILQDMVDKINASNDELQQLIAEMEAAGERLARFSDMVKKISDKVGMLAHITTKALSAGLL